MLHAVWFMASVTLCAPGFPLLATLKSGRSKRRPYEDSAFRVIAVGS